MVVAIVLWITGANAWTLSQPRYRRGEAQVRAALVEAYLDAGGCTLCWSSRKGALDPSDLAPNRLESLSVTPASIDGRAARLRVTASGPDGPVFGAIRIDYGDGTFSGSQLMAGTVEVAHTYARPGEYRLKAWLTPAGSTIRMADATVGSPTDRADRAGAHGVLSGGLPQSAMAGVAELADARDLKSRDPKGRPGSMPGPGTNRLNELQAGSAGSARRK